MTATDPSRLLEHIRGLDLADPADPEALRRLLEASEPEGSHAVVFDYLVDRAREGIEADLPCGWAMLELATIHAPLHPRLPLAAEVAESLAASERHWEHSLRAAATWVRRGRLEVAAATAALVRAIAHYGGWVSLAQEWAAAELAGAVLARIYASLSPPGTDQELLSLAQDVCAVARGAEAWGAQDRANAYLGGRPLEVDERAQIFVALRKAIWDESPYIRQRLGDAPLPHRDVLYGSVADFAAVAAPAAWCAEVAHNRSLWAPELIESGAKHLVQEAHRALLRVGVVALPDGGVELDGDASLAGIDGSWSAATALASAETLLAAGERRLAVTLARTLVLATDRTSATDEHRWWARDLARRAELSSSAPD